MYICHIRDSKKGEEFLPGVAAVADPAAEGAEPFHLPAKEARKLYTILKSRLAERGDLTRNGNLKRSR